MSMCGKCAAPLPSAKECLLCAECKCSFHAACTRVESVDKFKKYTTQRKADWKCDKCFSETAASASRSEHDSIVLQAIQQLKMDLSAQIGVVNSNVEAVKGQIDVVNTTIATMQQDLGSLVKENEQRKAEFEQVTRENAELRECVTELRDKVRDLEQYSRRDNLEVVGVPYSKGENVYEVLDKVAQVINVRYNRYDISTAHRLPASPERQSPAIIVRFVARDCKTSWMAAAREHRKRLTAAELCDSWPSSKVYINDHLTTHNKTILGRARRLVREKKLAFAWTRDGKVFGRKTASSDSPTKLLKSMDDLDALLVEQ